MNQNQEQNRDKMNARDLWHAKNGMPHGSSNSKTPGGHKKPPRALLIFGLILAGVLFLGILLKIAGFSGLDQNTTYAASIHRNHIAVLYIEGTIGDSDENYNQQYILENINSMIDNDSNEGLMLYVDTPGGSVYESDEVYLKVKEYQEATERPVYAYFASQATSGGYYLSASSDKILANRDCWTGSIGVTMGTIYDVSGLLEKYGIKAETITSGANKAMGSSTETMTDQQREIWQSMVDEAYDQFVGIVAEGRNLDEDYVRSIADGRIYTAKQAKANKLVDDVVDTYDDAVMQMQVECGLTNAEVYEFRYQPEESLLSSLVSSAKKLAGAADEKSDINALIELMEKQSQAEPQYLCEVRK